MSRAFALICSLCLIFTSGCSLIPGDEKNADHRKSEKKPITIEDFKSADDPKGMVYEGPGKYGGDKYEKKRVDEELDQFPKKLSVDEVYNRLVFLLAEDYKPLAKELENWDTSIEFHGQKTPGDANKPGVLEKELNVAILLDASGSMAGKVDGGQKMALAKQSIQKFAQNLPEGSNVSLQVYGHKGSNSQADKELSCKSTETVILLIPTKKKRSIKHWINLSRRVGPPWPWPWKKPKKNCRNNPKEKKTWRTWCMW